MLSPLPRRSDWAYCFAHFTQPCQPSLIWQSGRPAHCPFRGLLGVHSRYGLHTRAVTVFRDTLSEGFSHFVTSIAARVASGWSGCRVGFAPTGKRRLFTAHARNGHSKKDGAKFRNPGRRSVGLRVRGNVLRRPERREVPAKVQFEVARKTVTDITELGAARLRTRPRQGWEEHVIAPLSSNVRFTQP